MSSEEEVQTQDAPPIGPVAPQEPTMAEIDQTPDNMQVTVTDLLATIGAKTVEGDRLRMQVQNLTQVCIQLQEQNRSLQAQLETLQRGFRTRGGKK